MDKEKFKEREVNLVESNTVTDDAALVTERAQSGFTTIKSSASSVERTDSADQQQVGASDETFTAGKIALAQKVLGNRFQVLDVLGHGGMGAVYKVRMMSSDTIVALKLLKPELCQDKTVLKRFEYEAASLAELNHENIVSVYDHGITDDGAPYLTMQYLGGSTLSDYMENHRDMDPKQVVEIALQICAALNYAHDRKVVHRDVKPSNVIVIAHENTVSVQLVDFGIAKILDSTNGHTTNLTQTGDVFGTPAYMSPEQCEGREIDHRSDIYSLGCVLYEMLAGKQPFKGANPIQVAVKHISGKQDRFAEKYPDGHLITSLEQIVFKCMRKEKSERYQSMAELSHDLKKTMDGHEVVYAEESEFEDQKNKKNKSLMLLGGLFNSCISLLGFILYMSTITQVFSRGNALGFTDYDRGLLIGLMLFGFAHYTHKVATTKFNKRYSLEAWGEKLIYVPLLASFIFLLIGLVPSITPPFADFVAIGFLSTVILTWTLYIVSNVMTLFGHGVNLIKRLQDLAQKKAHVKPAPVPMRLSKALTRYAIAVTTLILVVVILNPGYAGNSIGGFGIVFNKFNSSLTVPALNWSVEHDSNLLTQLDTADLFTARGDKQRALEILTGLVNDDPENYNVRLSRAKALHALGRDKEALSDLNKAIGDHPDEADLLAYRGSVFLSHGQFAFARGDFDKAIASADRANQSATTGPYFSERGVISYSLGIYPEAIKDYTKALELASDENRERDYVRRALTYNAMGDRPNAHRDFQAAAGVYGTEGNQLLIKAYAAKFAGDMDTYLRELSAAEAKGAKQDDLTGYIFGEAPHKKLTW